MWREFISTMNNKTSSAGSATLGDTGWARLIIQPGPSNTLEKANPWLELARFSTSLIIQDTAEFGKGTELHGVWKLGGGGTPHIPIWDIWSEAQNGRTPHILIEVIWTDFQTRVGTPHKDLRCLRSRGGGGHRIFQLRLFGQNFKQGWGHHTKF